MKRNVVFIVAIVSSFLIAALTYPRLPEMVPVHWNFQGEVDRYGSRLEAVLVGPIAIAAIAGLFSVISWRRARQRRPDEERDTTGEKARETVESSSILLLTALNGVFMAYLTGILSDAWRGMALIVAAFLVVSGNFIGQVRKNRFVGVRTPWTLASDEVWRRTHRLAARLMVLGGVLLIAAAFVLSSAALIAAMLVMVLGSTLPPAVYSFVLWRREQAHRA